MNQPDAKKRKFTYFEHKDVFAALQQMATAETEKRGHVVTVPELIRELTLERANKILAKHGKKTIDYDPSAGKFAPGGATSPVQAIVNIDGKMTVFDKNGGKLPEWKKVQDIPKLLSLYPKCRIVYQNPNRKVA